MLFYYVRHGDPVYDPDSLTPLGHRQAEAIGRRLAMHGVDRVFTSTSNRAILTAKPLCELLKLKSEALDFANESHAWREMTYDTSEGRRWLFNHRETKYLSTLPEIRALDERWYEHPLFEKYNYKAGIERVQDALDEFFLSLGYEHIRGTGRYRTVRSNKERVAMFAHAGFGSLFFSCALDIPYLEFCARYDMCTTGLSVIDFQECGEWAIPTVLTFSNDSHIYKEGLPAAYGRGSAF